MKQNFLHTNQPATDEVLTNDSSVNPMFAAALHRRQTRGEAPRLFAARVAPPGATKLRRKSKLNKGLFTSTTDEWATPQALFDEYNREFHFTLDVCASENNFKVRNYFNKKINGLEQKWSGVCWMNPPYGREIGKWVKKAYEESKNGVTIVCLLPARTDTKYFHSYILEKAEIRFLKGRLKFGNSKQGAPFPSMIVVYNKRRNVV